MVIKLCIKQVLNKKFHYPRIYGTKWIFHVIINSESIISNEDPVNVDIE